MSDYHNDNAVEWKFKLTATCEGMCWPFTYAAGGGAWPGAVGLAQSDAGTLEVEVRKASNTAGCIEVVITHILDEKAILWRGQRWAVNNWDKRIKDNDIKTLSACKKLTVGLRGGELTFMTRIKIYTEGGGESKTHTLCEMIHIHPCCAVRHFPQAPLTALKDLHFHEFSWKLIELRCSSYSVQLWQMDINARKKWFYFESRYHAWKNNILHL